MVEFLAVVFVLIVGLLAGMVLNSEGPKGG